MNPLYIAWSPVYNHPLPEGHRFPMLKYDLIPEQLLHEGTISRTNLHNPEKCATDIVLMTHETAYVERLLNQTLSDKEQRAIGFKQSEALTTRELVIVQGTINCSLAAIENEIALNVAGGTHHAFADKGEGFCLLNDFAIAANYLLHRGFSTTILIIDLDLHQGNGTASVFAQNPNVFTFSMHGSGNYPFHKEKSNLDIPLAVGTTDAEYLQLLQQHLPAIIERINPDFAFYLSGVDILATDKFGKLAITLQGCQQRDAYVFNLLKQHHIPCAVAMGGGYSEDVRIIMEAHCNTFRTAKDIYIAG